MTRVFIAAIGILGLLVTWIGTLIMSAGALFRLIEEFGAIPVGWFLTGIGFGVAVLARIGLWIMAPSAVETVERELDQEAES